MVPGAFIEMILFVCGVASLINGGCLGVAKGAVFMTGWAIVCVIRSIERDRVEDTC